jgi:hypothetical protein
MSMTVRVVMCSVLTLSGVAACSKTAPAPARLVSLADGGNGEGIIDSKVDTPYIFDGMAFCLDRPGKVTIDGVLPYKQAGGLVVQDFAFVPNPFTKGYRVYGSYDGTIQQYSDPKSPMYFGAGADSKSVSVVCRPKANAPAKPGVITSVMLFVQFIRTSPGALDHGVTINYTSGGRHYSAVFPWDTWICAKGVTLCPGAPGYVYSDAAATGQRD